MSKDKIREISVLLSDCYKFGHRLLYPKGTTYVYSTLTPRDNTYFPYSDKMVVFGYEMFVKKWLVEHFNENFFQLPLSEVLEDYKYVVSNALGEENADSKHIEQLHNLGYLPIKIKALPEGSLVPMKVPVLTIENTHDDFAWLTNFLETLLISETFVTSTVATMALEMKKLAVEYGKKTADDLSYIPFQCHDFSERGQHGNEASKLSGLAHLTSFVGSDTIQASIMAHNYYNADLAQEAILKSVVASEHSVMQSYGKDELNTYATLIDRFPKGILSLVSDTYDYYGVLTNVLPKLKEEIMNRDGKLVIRPDSGNPVDIIEDSLQLLWEEFGGTINSKGFKVLDSHIGLLYGEGITVERMKEIFNRMIENGFSTENVVFGVGAYVYSVQISRDSFAQAVKSQMVTINGEDKLIFKDPKTDTNNIKRSLKGKVAVILDKETDQFVAIDGLAKDIRVDEDQMRVIFNDGEVLNETPFSVIRERLENTIK